MLDAPEEPACPEIRLAVELQDKGPLAWIGRYSSKLLLALKASISVTRVAICQLEVVKKRWNFGDFSVIFW